MTSVVGAGASVTVARESPWSASLMPIGRDIPWDAKGQQQKDETLS